MSSIDTDNTADNPGCETCPGGAACLLARMRPRSAYIAGCRAPQAREASTAYTRNLRAQKRAQGSAAGIAADWDDAAPDPETALTGDTCAECGAPVSWTVGRAGQECPNGHFRLPPDTAERAADSLRARKRASREIAVPDSGPTVAQIAALAGHAGRLIENIRASLAQLDTSQWYEMRDHGLIFGRPGWNEEIVTEFRARFNALIRLAERADSPNALAEITSEYLATAGHAEVTVSLIQQEFRDVAQRLTYRSNGQYTFRAIPNQNRLTRTDGPELATPDSLTSQQSRRMLPAARNFHPVYGHIEPEDDNYDNEDDDYDDEDDDYPHYRVTGKDAYGRNIIEDSSGFNPLVPIGLVIGLVVVIYAAAQAKSWWDRDGYIVCQNPEHTGRPALAREVFRGFYSTQHVCGKRECREWAHRFTAINNYEPATHILADADGNPGWNVKGNGKMRKNREFRGVRPQ